MEHDRLTEIKAMLRAVVQSTKNKITVDILNRDYRDMVGEDIPYASFGYPSLDQFLRSLTDTLLIVGYKNMVEIGVVQNSKSRHIHEFVMQQRGRDVRETYQKAKRMPNRYDKSELSGISDVRGKYFQTTFKNNENHLNENNILPNSDKATINHLKVKTNTEKIKTINENIQREKEILSNCDKSTINYLNVNKNTDGIKCVNENMQRVNVNCRGGAGCAKNLVVSSSYNLINNVNSKKELHKICNKCLRNRKHDMNVVKTEENTDVEKIRVNVCEKDIYYTNTGIKFSETNSIFRRNLLKTEEQFGTKIPLYILTSDIKVDSCYTILITEISSPFRFWFQIHRSDVHDLRILMEQINYCYKRLSVKDLHIPVEYITPTQVCCALYDKLWYRAEILTKPINGLVKVFFVDYGTACPVPVDDIKYLKLSFTQLPAQALLGRLSYVKPVGEAWTIAGTLYLLSLVYRSILSAKILDIDRKNHVYYMALCDINNNMTQIIMELVNKGYAQIE